MIKKKGQRRRESKPTWTSSKSAMNGFVNEAELGVNHIPIRF